MSAFAAIFRRDRQPASASTLTALADAAQRLAPGGTLISASCSYHLQREQLSGAILQAGRQLDLVPQLLASGGLGRDHPVHPAIPETNYLKAFMVRALPA